MAKRCAAGPPMTGGPDRAAPSPIAGWLAPAGAPPAPPADAVERDQLARRLPDGPVPGSAVLVTGPAASGVTSLLSQWWEEAGEGRVAAVHEDMPVFVRAQPGFARLGSRVLELIQHG
jgi:hypothetical protein